VRTIEKVNQVLGFMGHAELVRVSYGATERVAGGDTPPGVRIVIRGGEPELRRSFEAPSPYRLSEFPTLSEGEFEIELGEGSKSVRIRFRSDPPIVLRGGTEDPSFQRWIETRVLEIRTRATVLNKEDALQWSAVGGRGQETEWTAIVEPEQLRMDYPKRGTVPALCA
jgi:hypothetical protein